MATAWIDANGVALRYELAGTTGPLVVLLHEMGGTMDSWEFVLPVLQRSHRTLRYDMRGSGVSEKIRGEITGDRLADDLAALLDALGLHGKVALVGCAVGANIALRFATRFRARTGALILSSPATGIPPDRRRATLNMIARFERDGLRAVVDASFANSYPAVIREADPARFAATRARWLGNDPHSFAAVFRMLVETDLSTVLPTITAPTLLIGCTLDAVRPAEGTRAVAGQIPGARYATLDSGHFAAIQHPQALLELVLPFLHEHDAGLEPAHAG